MIHFTTCLCILLLANGAYCSPLNAQGLADTKSINRQIPAANLADVRAHYAPLDYVLGPGDQISLIVPGLEDEYPHSSSGGEKMFRIDASGDVTLPTIGRIHAAGLSTAALEQEAQARLKPVLKDPQVVVTIASFGSEPVSVLGAVRNPGIVQLQGRKTLFEVLSMAGGLQPEAGYVVQVTRPLKKGSIPLANTQTDPNAQVSIASIRLKDIINVPNARENIEIFAGDTISIPKAGIVYVVGSVAKPGGYPLGESESLSALQVLSLAEGLQGTASASKARILRTIPGSANRAEIPVNLDRLMAGKMTDLQLRADDILFVPGSKAKKAGLRTVDAIVNAATYASVRIP
jgi:polysaccharide biosynthesis/export protein